MPWPAFTGSRARPANRSSARSSSGRRSSVCAADSRDRMKFPLSLSLDLFRNRLARVFAEAASQTIVHLSPAAFPLQGGEEDALPLPALQTNSPVFWLGGQE